MRRTKVTGETFDIPCGKWLKINIWTIPMLVLSFFGDYGGFFLLAYLSSALHELSHILCAKLLKVGILHVKIYPFGISARLKSGYINSSEKEFFIAMAGPLCSLLLFWTFSLLDKVYPCFSLSFLSDTNLAICCINLLPCLPLDGGRMFKSILTTRYGIIRAYRFMLRLSKITLSFLIGFATALIFASHFNFSLVLISAFLLQNLAFEQQAISVVTLKEILSNRQKSENSENLPAKLFCVHGSRPASGILRHISYDCFFVVNVMDKDSRIIKTLTEVQVLDALIENGVRIKYKDIKN